MNGEEVVYYRCFLLVFFGLLSRSLLVFCEVMFFKLLIFVCFLRRFVCVSGDVCFLGNLLGGFVVFFLGGGFLV